jgi:hypothetical protein
LQASHHRQQQILDATIYVQPCNVPALTAGIEAKPPDEEVLKWVEETRITFLWLGNSRDLDHLVATLSQAKPSKLAT